MSTGLFLVVVFGVALGFALAVGYRSYQRAAHAYHARTGEPVTRAQERAQADGTTPAVGA